ncbi:SubName: Full=Uncharacterized protein {ECO:0000313/EMBL:CCA73404.1} [Serendipita indica DSM 11827]|nr:SubName: Full=Uncharacterized protein {ECO:0000313/EMBL:CCA73404.1} [Serendipita indica DSM 11827]
MSTVSLSSQYSKLTALRRTLSSSPSKRNSSSTPNATAIPSPDSVSLYDPVDTDPLRPNLGLEVEDESGTMEHLGLSASRSSFTYSSPETFTVSLSASSSMSTGPDYFSPVEFHKPYLHRRPKSTRVLHTPRMHVEEHPLSFYDHIQNFTPSSSSIDVTGDGDGGLPVGVPTVSPSTYSRYLLQRIETPVPNAPSASASYELLNALGLVQLRCDTPKRQKVQSIPISERISRIPRFKTQHWQTAKETIETPYQYRALPSSTGSRIPRLVQHSKLKYKFTMTPRQSPEFSPRVLQSNLLGIPNVFWSPSQGNLKSRFSCSPNPQLPLETALAQETKPQSKTGLSSFSKIPMLKKRLFGFKWKSKSASSKRQAIPIPVPKHTLPVPTVSGRWSMDWQEVIERIGKDVETGNRSMQIRRRPTLREKRLNVHPTLAAMIQNNMSASGARRRPNVAFSTEKTRRRFGAILSLNWKLPSLPSSCSVSRQSSCPVSSTHTAAPSPSFTSSIPQKTRKSPTRASNIPTPRANMTHIPHAIQVANTISGSVTPTAGGRQNGLIKVVSVAAKVSHPGTYRPKGATATVDTDAAFQRMQTQGGRSAQLHRPGAAKLDGYGVQ